MGMRDIMPKILGFLVIIITLALAPTINTANVAITGHANCSEMIGMVAIGAFGAPLIILGLLVSGGIFAVSGTKGALSGASVGDLLSVVGSVVVLIVVLTMFVNVMTYTATLIAASSGFAVTIYSIIPIIIYIGIIAMAGWTQVRAYRKAKGGKKSKSAQV